MNKTICDRCGKDIQTSIADKLSEPFKTPLYRMQVKGHWSEEWEQVDLCNECKAELKSFMKRKEQEEPTLKVQIDEGATAPSRAHPEDAGLDLYSMEDVIVPAYGGAKIHTGTHVELPKGTAGLLVSKSGLNVKHGLTSTGLIDEGYTGEIIVKLYNHSADAEYIHAGQKVSQLVILPVLRPAPEVVEQVLGGERGDNGFGSTGG